MLLIKIITEDTDAPSSGHASDHIPAHAARPVWMRVLAMEIMRGCVDIHTLFYNTLLTSRCTGYAVMLNSCEMYGIAMMPSKLDLVFSVPS